MLADVTVDWGQFGADPTAVANNASFAAGAEAGTVGGSASGFTMFTGSTYNADFLPANNVLALFDLNSGNATAGSFVLTFASPVFAAGAQVQPLLAGSFSGAIAAYNSANVLLGSFNISGSNGQNGNGSASFAGIISDAKDIKRIEFTGFGDGAAINQLSARTIAAAVPEPDAALMLLAGWLGVAAVARRRFSV
jgi:hypothetical protein